MTQENLSRRTHHNRDDLTGEHKIGDVGQGIIAVIFAVTWIADSFFLNWTTIYVNALQSIRNIIGVILLLFSGWLAMSTLSIVFREVRETPTVIRKGAYRYCRHPMYLSELILYFALLVMSLSVAALVIWLVAIGFLYFICRYEEKLLLERFGDEYRSYMQEVPMWLPRIFPGKH